MTFKVTMSLFPIQVCMYLELTRLYALVGQSGLWLNNGGFTVFDHHGRTLTP